MEILHKDTFSLQEIEALKIMARWRSDKKTNMASANLWSGDTDDAEDKNFAGHYLGIAGEFAVAKYMQGFFNPMPCIVGDKHQADVLLTHLGSIAVKTTKYAPPIFKISSKAEIEHATHVALCCYREPVLEITWIMDTAEFIKQAYVHNFGYGDRICL